MSSLSQESQQQVQALDQRIEKLEGQKQYHQNRAKRFTNQAERMQWNDDTSLEARRAYQLGSEEQDKADAIEQQIQALQAQRQVLLQGAEGTPPSPDHS